MPDDLLPENRGTVMIHTNSASARKARTSSASSRKNSRPLRATIFLPIDSLEASVGVDAIFTNCSATWPAENAELVQQTDNVYVADVEEIRGAQIGRQVLLLNLKTNYLRILVTIFDVLHRHTETLALRMRGGNGRKQVGCKRCNTTFARQVIANKSNLVDFRSFLQTAISIGAIGLI